MTIMKSFMRSSARLGLAAAALSTCFFVDLVAPASAYDPQRDITAELVSKLNSELAPSMRPAFYEDGATGRKFLFDRTGPHALLKFEDSPEVFALKATIGPRGDEFYRTDTGRLILRVTEIGRVKELNNVILFHKDDRIGAPTSLVGTASAISPPPHPSDFNQALEMVSQDIMHWTQAPLEIKVHDKLENYPDWTMDALHTVAIGVRKSTNHGPTRISAIRVSMGPKAGLKLEDEVLYLQIAPSEGFAGRPSSEAVRLTLRG